MAFATIGVEGIGALAQSCIGAEEDIVMGLDWGCGYVLLKESKPDIDALIEERMALTHNIFSLAQIKDSCQYIILWSRSKRLICNQEEDEKESGAVIVA